jgi:hypothetical protein
VHIDEAALTEAELRLGATAVAALAG